MGLLYAFINCCSINYCGEKRRFAFKIVYRIRDSNVRDGCFSTQVNNEHRDCCIAERASLLAGPDHVISAGVFLLRPVLYDDLGDSSNYPINEERIRHNSTMRETQTAQTANKSAQCGPKVPGLRQ